MNTLSSLLAFLGNTLGANPNTLVTTSKKLIGSINEAVGANPSTLATESKNLVGAANELKAFNDTKEITVTAAGATVGTLGTVVCRRSGNVVFLSIQFSNAGSVAVGSSIFACTLSSDLPRPHFFVTGCAYYSGRPLVGALNMERYFKVVNTSSSPLSIATADPATMSFAYITQD